MSETTLPAEPAAEPVSGEPVPTTATVVEAAPSDTGVTEPGTPPAGEPSAADAPPETVSTAETVRVEPFATPAAAESDQAFVAKLIKAEHKCREAEADVESLKEELSAAKKRFDFRVKALRDLIGEHERDEDRPLIKAAEQSTATAEPAPGEPPAAAAAVAPADDDRWKSVPTESLDFGSIKGFGKAKREALLEACPTLGQLEDLRAQFGGFTNIKGIGEKLAGEIENVILDWLGKHRDAFTQAPVTAAEVAASQTATGGDAPAPAAVPIPSAAEWDTMTDEARHNYLDGRAEALDTQAEGALHCAFSSAAWDSGMEGYNAGHELYDCTYIPGPQQDDWLRGWLTGYYLHMEPEAVAEPAVAASAAQEPEVVAVETSAATTAVAAPASPAADNLEYTDDLADL